MACTKSPDASEGGLKPALLHRHVRLFVLAFGCSSALFAEHRVQPKTSVDHPAFAIHGHATSDGALLAYYVRGDVRQRSALVLVPETHGDRSQFYERTFLDALPADLPLVVIESRGQGRSWPPPTPGQASIERYASDVLEIVASLRMPSWYIGGHSLGGMIALEIAGRRPANLKGAIALEGWVHSRVQREAFPAVTRTEAQQIDARAQREERYRTQRWNAEEYAGLGKAWTSWQRGEAIVRECELPLLSVWGDRGMKPGERPGREKLLLPERRNIEVIWIPGSDHYVTDPPFAGATAAAITRFVRRVEAAPAHQIVYREPGRFGGWPANHGIWSWGDEVAVGFTAAWHQAQDVTRHQMDRAKAREQMLARTRDGGRTWTIEQPAGLVPVENADVKPVPLADAIDFTHPGFALTLRFHEKDNGASYFFFSYDKGKRWSGPHEFPKLGTPAILARTDYIVHGPREMTLFLTAAKTNRREGRPLCARTTDGGRTWKMVSYIGPEPEGFVIMPSAVALDTNSFLATVRVKDPAGTWIDAWLSRDRGMTWQPHGRPVPDCGGTSGNPPHVIRLRDGRLCLTYGYRSAPMGIRAKLSRDNGATWGDEIVLREDGVTHDLGYPRSFQRDDGKVVTVYYYNDGLQTERFIAATTWDPGKS
jgi:pimeloyl-ACP methyl ester carboxylesterase